MWSLNINYADLSTTDLILTNRNITDIEKDIKKMKNLTRLNLSTNKIKKIPDEIQSLINLRFLNISVNYINNIPNIIKFLTNLQVVKLSYNLIKKIPPEIGFLVNLINLELNHNKIVEICPEIQNCTKLAILNLESNHISVIPPFISSLVNLKELYLSINHISVIPPELCTLRKVKIINLSLNQISVIPPEINGLVSLKHISFYNNKISVIPSQICELSTLIMLTFSDNNITEIPDEIGRLTNLIELIVSYNLITNININIINCRSLQLFRYNGNPVENISPSVTRFLRNTIGYSKDDKQLEVYDDNQNIHNHIIQESIRKSIMNIINQNLKIDEDKIMSEINDDSILSLKTKKLIEEYSKDTYYHSVLLITFKELLMYVWMLISINEHKNEIKSILNIEILDSENKCFTGRLSRLINCLNGFSELVEINISDNQQIANIIIITKNNLEEKNEYSIEKHKEIVIKELKMRSYSNDLIAEWVEQIQE